MVFSALLGVSVLCIYAVYNLYLSVSSCMIKIGAVGKPAGEVSE